MRITTFSTTAANFGQTCKGCDKQVDGGTYINGVFYCPMCASIINRNNGTNIQQRQPFIPYQPPEEYNWLSSACDMCSSNPKNGGSGICHCILGLPQIR